MKVATILVLAALIVAIPASVQAAIVAADIDHNWNFDDGLGTTADDRFGDADGELSGTVAWSTTDVQVGTGAVDFAGGVVDISSISGTYLNDFSVSMWVKARTAGGGDYGRFMVNRGSAPSGTLEWLWHINMDGHTTMGVTGPGGGNHQGAAGSVAFNTYQHVTFTISEADVEGDVTINQYVNGALAGSAITLKSPTAGSQFMGIGNNWAYAGSNDRWFDGLIDEVVIFNRELTGTEIGDFYTNLGGSAAGFDPVTPDPIPGDANLDNIVNDQDASILAAHWQQTGMGWGDGDFNNDQVVNDQDASILAAHWQESQEGAAPVPEPSTVVGLLALGLAALVAVARRRR